MIEQRQRRHLNARAYVLTFGALLGLSGATFGLSFLSLGALEVPVALAIAGAKAALVVFFFMHLAEQRKSNALLLVVGAFLMATLVGLVVADVATRDPGVDRAPLFPDEPATAEHVVH